MKKIASKKGFTLIELLIVIVIIGILAAALLPSILGAPARARDAGRKADINDIIAAVEMYYTDNGEYPDPGGCADAVETGALNAYFQGGAAPADPSGEGPGGGCDDGYLVCPVTGVTGVNYFIAAYMENEGGGNADAATVLANDCSVAAYGASPALGDSGDAYIVIK